MPERRSLGPDPERPVAVSLAGAARFDPLARWVLLAVFVTHNLDEILLAGPTGPLDPAVVERLGISPELYRLDRFALGTLLITVAVAAVLLPVRQPVTHTRAILVTMVAGALGLNGVTHLIRAVVEGGPAGGFWTAPILIASSAFVLLAIRSAGGLRPRQVVLAVLGGAAVTVPAILLILGLSSGLLR